MDDSDRKALNEVVVFLRETADSISLIAQGVTELADLICNRFEIVNESSSVDQDSIERVYDLVGKQEMCVNDTNIAQNLLDRLFGKTYADATVKVGVDPDGIADMFLDCKDDDEVLFVVTKTDMQGFVGYPNAPCVKAFITYSKIYSQDIVAVYHVYVTDAESCRGCITELGKDEIQKITG